MWATQYMGLKQNSSFSFTLPAALPSDQYLLRIDIVSLQVCALR
jgi:hypothetical protein